MSRAAQRELVRELLARLDELLQAAYVRARAMYEQKEAGEVRPWAYRGLYVTREQVEELLGREPAAPVLSATEGNAAALDAFGKAPLWGAFGQHLGLSAFDIAITVLALAPEVDVRYARLYAYLQDDVTRRRPTVSLALDVLAPSADAKIAERQHFLPSSPLIRSGLLTLLADPSQAHPTLLDHSLKLNDQAVCHLLGHPDPAQGLAARFEVVPPGATVSESATDLSALLPLIQDAKTYLRRLVLYFRGPAGMGQRLAAEALAGSLETTLVAADLAAYSPQPERFHEELASALREGLLREGAVFLDGFDALCADDAKERLRVCLRALALHPGPVIVSGARPFAPEIGGIDDAIVLEFPAPSVADRRAAWGAAIKEARVPVESSALDTLAQRYPLSLDQIASTARTVASRLRWHAGRPAESQPRVIDELTAAARAQCSHDLASLAHRIVPRRGWDDLVLPPDVTAQLRELCQRVVQRQRVLEEWGFDRKLSYGTGVSALFTGPSGAGKTMAAEVIARELDLDLFKIDLSQVVSKYIGETEKNLEKIFLAAERTNAILFFDEADALFGKRSEIHDAHDRYANIEVGYLLQRMERYEGVAILATNLRRNLDEAFARRLAYAIQFPFPDAQLRQEIWTKAWPSRELLAGDVDLARLAAHFKLSGGNIKNVALASAFLAAHERGPVTNTQILRAIAREYQKVGKKVSEQELATGLGLSPAAHEPSC
ncbi:AAA family ATPase [Sorangium sp. So ce542]|uniref:AAA family ATPase n=1 Tax=Sorangium sp. So ce542 TaxID=3133316 RepID=UPI003F615F15